MTDWPEIPGRSQFVNLYCRGYRTSARMKTAPDTGLIHTGFRCVLDPEKRKVKTAEREE